MNEIAKHHQEIAELLPEDIKNKFIHNIKTLRHCHGTPCLSPHNNMLYHSFYFDETPEGYWYWMEVYEKYVKEKDDE
jgi:hypothetical protein